MALVIASCALPPPPHTHTHTCTHTCTHSICSAEQSLANITLGSKIRSSPPCEKEKLNNVSWKINANVSLNDISIVWDLCDFNESIYIRKMRGKHKVTQISFWLKKLSSHWRQFCQKGLARGSDICKLFSETAFIPSISFWCPMGSLHRDMFLRQQQALHQIVS